MTVVDRLEKAGFKIPQVPQSVANYVGAVQDGDLVFVSGQLPIQSGEIAFTGKVGKDLDVALAKKAAELCAVNILSQVQAVVGDLGRVKRCVRLGGFVNCEQDFSEHPAVINGASDLLVLAFGDAGRHARAAVGCSSLPLNAAVEIEAVFSLKPSVGAS